MEKVWNAINDDTRRKILSLLKARKMAVSEIVSHFKITQPTISHHLSVLKNAGLVDCVKIAQSIVYSINNNVFNAFISDLSKLFGLKIIK